MSMIENVARAIRAETSGIPDDGSSIEGDGEHYVGLYTDVARAAIEAMREPTKEMLALHKKMAGNELCWDADEETVARTWGALIDAALVSAE
jgi:hypothetical protein